MKSTTICLVCGNNDTRTSYFTFPKDEAKRKSWLKICGLDDPSLYISRSARICANHFTEDSYTKSLNEAVRKRRLKEGVVPTLNVKSKFSQNRSNYLLKSNVSVGNGHWCFLCGYSQYSVAQSFHKFPGNIEARKIWLKNIDMADVPLSAVENKLLCCIHFSSDDIVVQPVSGKRCLRPKAVPLIVRNNRGSKYICGQTFIRPTHTLNSNKQNCQENNNHSKSTSMVKICDGENKRSRNFDASLRSPHSLQNDHSMAKSDESENEDVILCEELSTPIIYISDEENMTSCISTHKKKVAKSSKRDSNLKSKSSSSFKMKSTVNDPSNSVVICVSDEEDIVTDTWGDDVSEICPQIKQQITSEVCEIPTSTTLTSQHEKSDKSYCANVNSTTDLNEADITENNQNNAATSSGKHKIRSEKIKKRDRLLKQKLNDYQKLFNDLLEKDLVTERGKRLINKIQAKYDAGNQKPSSADND